MFDGVVRAAVAPLYARPDVLSPQISQLVLGSPIAVLERTGAWLRVHGEDGYAGWVHAGYVHALSGASPDPQAAFSLGAELHDCGGRLLARLPWGARVSRNGAGYRLPDGRHGFLAAGFADFPVEFTPKRHKVFAQTLLLVIAACTQVGAIGRAGDADDTVLSAAEATDHSQRRTGSLSFPLFAVGALAHFFALSSVGFGGGGIKP